MSEITQEQNVNRKETSIKVLESMLSEQKAPKDMDRRLEYDLKIMALTEGIGALRIQLRQLEGVKG